MKSKFKIGDVLLVGAPYTQSPFLIKVVDIKYHRTGTNIFGEKVPHNDIYYKDLTIKNKGTNFFSESAQMGYSAVRLSEATTKRKAKCIKSIFKNPRTLE